MKNAGFKKVVLAGIVMASLVAIRAEAAGKIQYKLNLQKGQKYHTRTMTEQQIAQTVMGQPQKVEQTIGMGTDFDVNDVDENGNAWICYTYRWIKFEQKGPMGEISYDSSEKDSSVPPPAQGLVALIGEQYQVRVTPKGQVVEVKGLDKMRSSVREKLPEGPMKENMMKGLEQYLSAEALKEITESSMAIYPETAVGIGDSWNKTILLSHGFAMILENKWTLKQRKDDVSIIEVDSSLKPNPEAKPLEMGTTKMSYEISGTQKGIIEIQESTGLVARSEMNQEMSGQIKMVISGPQSQEMIMPMEMKGVVTTETSEREKS